MKHERFLLILNTSYAYGMRWTLYDFKESRMLNDYAFNKDRGWQVVFPSERTYDSVKDYWLSPKSSFKAIGVAFNHLKDLHDLPTTVLPLDIWGDIESLLREIK